jgi:hypothetical protein
MLHYLMEHTAPIRVEDVVAPCVCWICIMETVRSGDARLDNVMLQSWAKEPLKPLIYCFLYSEWVLETREDLVKDIVSELRPDLGEVRQAFFFVLISIT